MPQMPSCGHRGKNLVCSLLKREDIVHFHKQYYIKPEKNYQDSFLCKYVNKENPKRRVSAMNLKPKTLSLQFYIENQIGNKIRVCRDTFLNVLGITKHRVLGVHKNFKKDEESLMPSETRGG